MYAWSAFVAQAPPIWLKGPHARWREGALALHDPHDFGRYNPAFVRWLVDNAIAPVTPATTSAYDKYIRKLARTYFAVHKAMKPDWIKRERALYLKTMDEKKDLSADDEKALHAAIKDWKKNGSF